MFSSVSIFRHFVIHGLSFARLSEGFTKGKLCRNLLYTRLIRIIIPIGAFSIDIIAALICPKFFKFNVSFSPYNLTIGLSSSLEHVNVTKHGRWSVISQYKIPENISVCLSRYLEVSWMNMWSIKDAANRCCVLAKLCKASYRTPQHWTRIGVGKVM